MKEMHLPVNESPVVAIIGLPYLLQRGVAAIVKGLHNSCRCNAVTLDELDSNPNRYDLYIVSAEEYIARPDIFMPRKSRVILRFSYPIDKQRLAMPSICDTDSAEEIESTISSFISSGEEVDTGSNLLTTRETEILRHIAAGKTNKEIADRLNISVNTATTHRKNISRKLGIKSVSGLSLYALMHGIIEP